MENGNFGMIMDKRRKRVNMLKESWSELLYFGIKTE